MFQRNGAGGNPLGFVADSSGLAGAGMQEIATHLGFSETVFLGGDTSRPQVRIFTPATELPFAGHPLVGTVWALHRMGSLPATVRCGIGEVEVVAGPDLCGFRIGWEALGTVRGADATAATTFGLAKAPAWWVQRPGNVLVVLATDHHALDAAPSPAVMATTTADGLYHVYENSGHATARFYAPRLGVPEDPATGSAAAALANVHRHMGRTSGRLTIDQGDYVDAPSRIVITWTDEGVTVAGAVALTSVVEVDV